MRRGTLRTPAWSLAAFGLAVALAGCGSSEDPNSIGTPGSDPGSSTSNPNGTATSQTPDEQVKQILDSRKTDYGEALRTASLKLTDQLPTLAQINSITAAADDAAKKVVYEKAIDDMIASKEFATMMTKYWKDTFKTGNLPGAAMPAAGTANKDSAAFFAAEVFVEDRGFSDILTAATNTCPTYDATTGVFTPAACMAGAVAGPTSGVLTDPAILTNYFSNMAFRRSRFFQETFACTKFPTETSKTPTPMGNGTYTGPLDFNRITGLKNATKPRVDFQDTSAVICANCHVTQNFLAPAWANYDAKGLLTATPQVEVPIPGTPIVKVPDDYQPPATYELHWRAGLPNAVDVAGIGKQMAADPEVGRCAVNRMWNYAMSRGDIVNDLSTVPLPVTDQLTTDFNNGGQKMKATIKAIFKSEDFTKF